MSLRVLTFIAATVAVLLRASDGAEIARVEFNRDVRPILADTCFKCHGFDKHARKGDLRLDVREDAIAARAIVPGDVSQSEAWKRITSHDPDDLMPPAKSNLVLTNKQKETIKRWIEQGAEYQPHWAFIAPRRADVPAVAQASWVRNEIDAFVLAALEQGGLSPSHEADRATLIRRVTLDLTGLPPTIAEVDQFLADTSPNAYEALVDRLLASPHYGERMALDWLDAARYADTHGYQRDAGRDMTRWRDWVIEAFNRNTPFDRFTVEQIAGDMLPDATVEQKIASGFNRNHRINIETGAVPEEFLAAYVTDRVDTTATVWLGLTANCAQCHDHKYDPLTQAEYYGLYAFFNNVPENGIDGGTGNAAPLISFATDEQQKEIDRLAAELKDFQKHIAANPAKDEKERAALNKKHTDLTAARETAVAALPTAMVMQELPQRRETRLLIRGQYDQLGAAVAPGVPAFLPPLPKDAPANRLGLARWLVDPSNPLTARVTVNRIWQTFFGTGLVKTSEDFGTQGELPSHPELLDWLAVDFRDGPVLSGRSESKGWDVKRMVKRIVTSATYRQSSRTTPEHLAADPECRLLTRFPRKRLPAEFIRDQALAASGLLDQRIGGASVMPYQPLGLWEEMTSREGDMHVLTAQSYTQSHGADLYRRSMYTFWKRTVPPPQLSTFDAPDRETCTVRRGRTNTPLQALVLMNDPTYVEASRKLAERILKEGGRSDEERLTFAFRAVLARRPAQNEATVLRVLYERQLMYYQEDAPAAAKLLSIGESTADHTLDRAQLAAWTIVASAILNLDEAVVKG